MIGWMDGWMDGFYFNGIPGLCVDRMNIFLEKTMFKPANRLNNEVSVLNESKVLPFSYWSISKLTSGGEL